MNASKEGGLCSFNPCIFQSPHPPPSTRECCRQVNCAVGKVHVLAPAMRSYLRIEEDSMASSSLRGHRMQLHLQSVQRFCAGVRRNRAAQLRATQPRNNKLGLRSYVRSISSIPVSWLLHFCFVQMLHEVFFFVGLFFIYFFKAMW